jgi:putative methionine-R-sulfoxide reductase with GAF domain
VDKVLGRVYIVFSILSLVAIGVLFYMVVSLYNIVGFYIVDEEVLGNAPPTEWVKVTEIPIEEVEE